MSNSKFRKSLLIGLDGATFDLFEPWMKDGTFPNLARLASEGVKGNLASTIPPTTPPAWAACVTGKNPGKHGIFDFMESPLLDFDRPLITLRSMKSVKIWQIFNKLGRKTGIINVPITYPPEKTDGFMISGMMTPGPEAPYSEPPEIKAKILSEFGDYVPNIDIPKYDVDILSDALEFIKDIKYSFQKRQEVFFYLMDTEPWHFLMVVFILPDRIQHLFWKYLDPNTALYNSKKGKYLRPLLIEAYRLVDDMFGQLYKKLDDNTDLLVMSDHGFGPTFAYFNANTWLAKQGLLKVHNKAWLKKRIFYQAMVMNDSKFIKRLIPVSLQSRFRKRIRAKRSSFTSPRSDIAMAIDWSKTKAFLASIPTQGIYINIRKEGTPGIVNPGAEAEKIRAQIKKALLELKDPKTKKKVIDEVYDREEVYHGPQTEFAPDILFKASDYGVIGRQLLGGRELFRSCHNLPNGFHRSNGVFMAWGKNFKAGYEISGASIIDIAPTLLYSASCPVPEDMDGKVLKEIFLPEYLEKNPIQTCAPERFADLKEEEEKIYSDAEQQKIKEHLKGLGYIE